MTLTKANEWTCLSSYVFGQTAKSNPYTSSYTKLYFFSIYSCIIDESKCIQKFNSMRNYGFLDQQLQEGEFIQVQSNKFNKQIHYKQKALFQSQFMKSYQKHIRFQDIELRVQKQHTKDISRVHFKIIEESHDEHKTKKYGNVNPTQIIWPTPIEFLYKAQRSFKFQTICEHEYGYQVQELKALYYGQIKIKPEDFFHINRFTVFNRQGQKCGRVSFMIKVIDREVGIKYNQDQQIQNRERIRVDLVGRLSFAEANLKINSMYMMEFQGKKSIKKSCQLQVKIDGTYMIGKMKNHQQWMFKDVNKAELFKKSDDHIRIRIMDGEKAILQGKLMIEILLKNKRFTTQTVIMQNEKGVKIGSLAIQMRIVEKKEILDLMYSPKKLEEVKMQNTAFDMQSSRISQSFEKNSSFSEPILQKINKRVSLDTKNRHLQNLHQSPQASPRSSKKNRYQLYFRNQYQDSQFAKSKRFPDIKSNNPYISYTGQEQGSDFSPKRKGRVGDFSLTERTDFTKQFKDNPGIGDYHLPSIWERS